MNNTKMKTLLAIAKKDRFCVETKDGQIMAVTENAEGQIKDVIHCIGKEIFGEWPLNAEDQLLFKSLTALRFQPAKKSNRTDRENKSTGKSTNTAKSDKSA